MKEHLCKTIEKCDFVTIIQHNNDDWLWMFTPKGGKTVAHGILYCPY